MAGGYGANGSSTTAVLNGLRNAAAARASGSSGSVNAGGVASNGATTAQTVGTQSFTGGSAADLLSQSSGPQMCSIKDDPNVFNGVHRALTRGESLRLDWNIFIDDLPLGSGGKSLYHWATDDVVQTITETIDGDYRRAGVSAAISFFPWIKTAKKIGLDDAAESLLRRFGDDVAGGMPRLAAPVMHDHHLMPRQFRGFFSERGIDIDAHTISIGERSHLAGLHGQGLGNMPGRWNKEWIDWIKDNPNATEKDVYQQLGTMMDRYNINDFPVHRYGQ
jgi:hypothetical protein